MGIDSDRFDRPTPCKWCGEIFEHRFECPAYSYESDEPELYIKPRHKQEMHCIDKKRWEQLISILFELTSTEQKDYITYWGEAELYECSYCYSVWKEEEKHAEDCPVLLGQKLLEELK